MIPHSVQDEMLYLCKEDVLCACTEIDSVAVIRNVFHLHGIGETVLPDEAYLTWTNRQGEQVRSLNMPGYLGGSLGVAGTKIINGNIHNSLRGVPRASGVTLLYDDLSVRIMCIMEGSYISSLRTASVTALSVDLLKGRDVQCVAVIGAGALARAHIELLVQRLPHLQQVLLFDIDQRHMHALHEELALFLQKQEREVELIEMAGVEETIRPAQLIVPVTTTTTGYIPFAWLQPGALLVNVSLDDPLPEVVLQANKVFVDDWTLVKNDTRRLLGRMYRAGQIAGPNEEIVHANQRQIDAHLGEIVSGRVDGRSNDDDIILVNPFGMAIEDVALATEIYRVACERGYGIWLKR